MRAVGGEAHGGDAVELGLLARIGFRLFALLVAPAMNVEMWENPATRRNVSQLRADGVSILGPASGDQACGETGIGRMLEPQQLYQEVVAFLAPKILSGKRVLVTAGPTFSPR